MPLKKPTLHHLYRKIILSRDSSRRRRGKTNTILPYLNWQYQAVKQVTVRKECGSRRGDQVFALSDLRSPDIGRGKREKPNDWLGPQNGSGAPFPSAEVNRKKLSFWAGFITGRRTIAILLRVKDKRLTETRRTPKSFKPVLKTEQSLLARERKKFSSGTPSKIR